MKFYQITDLHYYPAKLLKAQGKEWINRAMYDQKCIAESEAILDATIQMLLDDKEIGIVLITGDNVCDGERVGHISLADKQSPAFPAVKIIAAKMHSPSPNRQCSFRLARPHWQQKT